MNSMVSYATDALGGRGRAFSFDGQPPPMQQQAPLSPRFYPSNQPTYRPTYGAPGAYPQTAYPAYTTAPGPVYTQAPYPQQIVAGPPAMVGGPPPANNSTVCCPLPGPQENPQASHSDHAFQSNLPAGECEGLVRRDVEYQTEWVAVPVQKPIVYETYQRVVEIPTQHLVSVQNVPGQVPPRQCDTTTFGGIAGPPMAYNAGVPQIGYNAASQVSYQPQQYVQTYQQAPVSYQPAPVAYNGGPMYGGYGPAPSGAVSPVPWAAPGGAPAMVGGPGMGPMRTFSM